MTIQSWEHERQPILGTHALQFEGYKSDWVSQAVSPTSTRSVHVEGMMLKLGDDVIPSHRTKKALIAMAGGVNRCAFQFRVDVAHVSVRTSPQVEHKCTLHDIKLELSLLATSTAANGAEEITALSIHQADSDTRTSRSESTFVVRAKGSVSGRQQQGWLGLGGMSLSYRPVLPREPAFVPQEFNRVAFLQGTKNWMRVFCQFGVELVADVIAIELQVAHANP